MRTRQPHLSGCAGNKGSACAHLASEVGVGLPGWGTACPGTRACFLPVGLGDRLIGLDPEISPGTKPRVSMFVPASPPSSVVKKLQNVFVTQIVRDLF